MLGRGRAFPALLVVFAGRLLPVPPGCPGSRRGWGGGRPHPSPGHLPVFLTPRKEKQPPLLRSDFCAVKNRSVKVVLLL